MCSHECSGVQWDHGCCKKHQGDNHMTSNQSRVAIITGGSSGIGRATAIALSKQGVKVTVASRRPKEGEETIRLVKEAGGDGIF